MYVSYDEQSKRAHIAENSESMPHYTYVRHNKPLINLGIFLYEPRLRSRFVLSRPRYDIFP